MSRAAAALEDPAVAQALRSYRAASARLSGLADSATRLEESFASEDELRAVELAADEAQVELGDAARTLDELLGDDVLARKLRMSKEEALKIPEKVNGSNGTSRHVGRGHGEFKRCECGGILRGRHREFCKLNTTAPAIASKPTLEQPREEPRAAATSERLDEGTRVTAEVVKASPPPTYNEASSLCDELKAKLAARYALDVEIRELAARLAQVAGAA